MRRITGIALAYVAVALAAALNACASDEVAEAFTVTDSAGVSIAISRQPLWPESGGWRLGAQPSVLLGGGVTDTTAIIGPIAGAMRLPDGRIVVADEGATRLRWFADDGTILQSVGRKGDGPGEFRGIDALLHVGDSMAVLDNSLRRLSILDLEGRFGRSITLENPPEGVFPPSPLGRLASGEWIALVSGSHSTGEASRPVRDSVKVWLVSTSGVPLSRFAAFPGDDKLIFATSDFVGETRPPFGRNTTIRFHDGQLWVGTGDGFLLERWGVDGELKQSVRWAGAPRPMDQSTFDRVRDSIAASFADADAQWRAIGSEITKALDSWTPPAKGPAFGSFKLDDGGHLWVSDYALEGSIDPVTWHVFGTDGRLLGPVVFPPLVTPTQISSDEVLGVWTDPDGVEHVVAYPLLKDSSGM